jgi:hypothetical protein
MGAFLSLMGLMQLVHSHYQILGLDDVCSAQPSMVGSPMLVCPQLPLGFFQRAPEKVVAVLLVFLL